MTNFQELPSNFDELPRTAFELVGSILSFVAENERLDPILYTLRGGLRCEDEFAQNAPRRMSWVRRRAKEVSLVLQPTHPQVVLFDQWYW
jgi:hypothetical protein